MYMAAYSNVNGCILYVQGAVARILWVSLNKDVVEKLIGRAEPSASYKV